MLKLLKRFFGPPFVNADSSLLEIEKHYPILRQILNQKYGITLASEHKSLSLKTFCTNQKLPPPQIVFMEIQLAEQLAKIQQIPPKSLAELVTSKQSPKIIDAREKWELTLGSIPGSAPLSEPLWNEILKNWDRSESIVVYCHFGVRSLDVASELVKEGFTRVGVLKGGIDAWSEVVDPNLPRYTGAYC